MKDLVKSSEGRRILCLASVHLWEQHQSSTDKPGYSAGIQIHFEGREVQKMLGSWKQGAKPHISHPSCLGAERPAAINPQPMPQEGEGACARQLTDYCRRNALTPRHQRKVSKSGAGKQALLVLGFLAPAGIQRYAGLDCSCLLGPEPMERRTAPARTACHVTCAKTRPAGA